MIFSPYGSGVKLVSALVLVFLAAPVLFIVLFAFYPTGIFVLPPPGLTVKWFLRFFASERFRAALAASFGIAAIVTPVSLAIAVPTAIALVRRNFPGRGALNVAILSPLVIPGVVSGIAFLDLFSRLDLQSGFWRITIAMICFSLPFSVRAISANLYGLDPALEEAARNLGGSRWQALWHVTLPQLRPGLLAGGIFVFVEAIDNFSIAVFLTDLHTTTLPVEAYGYIRDFDDPTVAAMATLLIVLSVVLVFSVQRLVGLDRFLDLR
jgi:putative spermidine/putrescine transport system permease protein